MAARSLASLARIGDCDLTYIPPLADMRFVLRHVVDIGRLATMPGLRARRS